MSYRINRSIGLRIGYGRKLAGLSQPQLAARMTEHSIATSRDQLASVESGRRSARADELLVIAQILERPVGWFFEEAANLLDGDIAIPGLRFRAPAFPSEALTFGTFGTHRSPAYN